MVVAEGLGKTRVDVSRTGFRYTLSDSEKKAYLDAELCLMSKPSTLGLRGSRTKFDDFQAAHVLQSEIAHFVVGLVLAKCSWMALTQLVKLDRANSSPSIVFSYGPMSKPLEQSAGIPGLIRKIRPDLHCLNTCLLSAGTGRKRLMLAPSPRPSSWTPS